MDIAELEKGMHSGRTETITFGMGCFWSPDAMFGAMEGVVRTRVGYAGGTAANPTYRTIGDHTETVQADFDPEVISYAELLRHFWKGHNPNRGEYKGRQYISLLRYHSEEQLQAIEKVKTEMERELNISIETEIAPFTEFTLAEQRHQKYFLKRYPRALDQLEDLILDEAALTDSTFAARLNGLVKSYVSRNTLLGEMRKWPVAEQARKLLQDRLMQMKW